MGGDHRLVAAAIAIAVAALTAAAPVAQGPVSPAGPRDFRPEARGTATIRGRVTVDGTPAPVRGAMVRAIPRSAGEVLTTHTDEEGRFSFTGLAVGRWSIDVEKGGYLTGHFGQRTATGPGTTLALVPGDTHAVEIPLVKGAVIAGHLVDDAGEPGVAARVQAMRWTTVEGRQTLVQAGEDQTDDTGAFRIHTLPPGEYVVVARGGGNRAADVIRIDDNGSGRVMLINHAGDSGFSRSVAPTYFPGAATAFDAQRLVLRRGEERVGITFALSAAPLVRVSGTVVSATGSPIDGQVTVSLMDPSGQSGPGPGAPGSRRSDGSFELRDVAPGSYLLVAAHGSPASRSEFATMPVVVGGEDLTGVTLVTRPGGSVRGTVTAEGGAKPDAGDMGVYARPVLRGAFPFVDVGTKVRDGRFEIPSIATTARLHVERVPRGWALKSIIVSGVDVTDTPIEFTSGQRLEATIVLTDRLTRLAGVATVAGKPSGQATVVVFPADPARWSPPSRFVATARADDSGNYTVAGLPPLENYLAAAVDEYESTLEQDPEFLERLRPTATPLSLAEGESKRLNLAVAER
jgi:hypothetical protein